jgi:hypothetical protein
MKLIFFVVFLELVLKYLIEVLHAGKFMKAGSWPMQVITNEVNTRGSAKMSSVLKVLNSYMLA